MLLRMVLIIILAAPMTVPAQEMVDMVGEELMVANKKATTGYVFMAISTITTIGGSAIIPKDREAGIVLLALGGLSSVISLGNFISAWGHVGAAGELMKLDAMSLNAYPSRNGITLALKF